MLVSDFEFVFSVDATIDMQSYGISEKMVEDAVTSGIHEKISDIHGIYKSGTAVNGRVVHVLYVRRPPEGNKIIVGKVFWAKER